MKFLKKFGGWYRDRTCDPYHVKVVLRRYLIGKPSRIYSNVLVSFLNGSRQSWAILGKPWALLSPEKPAGGWYADCNRWHGRGLTGQYRHYCPDWDYLPIDNTVMEFDACTCLKIGLWMRGSVWTHVKSGQRYVLEEQCRIEADLTEAVLYRREDGTGPLWCRPMAEFTDGRFRPESAP